MFFVDVGAGHGQYVNAVDSLLKRGRILALEAEPFRYDVLSGNCRAWSQGSTNSLECLNAAACDRAGEVVFYSTATLAGASSRMIPRLT